MRLVFFGASRLGYQACRMIIEEKLADVVGIFTIPRRFDISYSEKPVTNVLFEDFHQLGEQHNIPVIDVAGKMASFRDRLATLEPDFLLVIGWYYMIPRSLRELAPLGCAGVHGSLLPKYRGGAPLVWAMINGEKTTGMTLFHFEDGVDDGDIIGQREFPIESDETIAHVLEKAEVATLDLVRQFVPKISDGTAPRIPQDHSQATSVPQRSPEDGLIDWSWEPERIRNFIRAQTRPYPGAFTIINGRKVTIWDADVMPVNVSNVKSVEE